MNVMFFRRYSVENAMARAFKSLGHHVCFVNPDENIVTTAQKNNANLFFFMCFNHIPGPEKMKHLNAMGTTIYWERGSHGQRMKHPEKRGFKHIFTTTHDDPCLVSLPNRFHYLPCASEDHSSLRIGTEHGVTCVAQWGYKSNGHRVRYNLQEKIKADLQKQFTPIAGSRYNLGYSHYDNRFKYMANSLISINIWKDWHALPLRAFEIPSCGTPMMSYPYPLLSAHFTPGVHYIETENMAESLAYYKAHPDELARIGKAGYEHFVKHHTYKTRVKQILASLR